MWKLLTAVPLALSLVNPTFAVAQEAPASQKSVPEQIVDAFNGLFGVHPGARSNHAKGVVLEGTFTPTASAASVSKAAHLQKAKVPVTVRFSDATGIPTIPDNDAGAGPRGIALKFNVPAGSQTDIEGNSFKGFAKGAADEVADFLLTPGARGPEAAHRAAVQTVVRGHPRGETCVPA